jgi:hypothetical protein
VGAEALLMKQQQRGSLIVRQLCQQPIYQSLSLRLGLVGPEFVMTAVVFGCRQLVLLTPKLVDKQVV